MSLRRWHNSTHLFNLDLALEEGIPITDPGFYASDTRCPATLLRHIFRPAPHSVETIPLFEERVKILREVGPILETVRLARGKRLRASGH